MNTGLLRRFNDILPSLEDRDYLLAKVACEVAPTLMGLKPATLMSFGAHGRNLRQLWGKFKPEAEAVLQLQYFEMKNSEKHTLVLFYRHDLLESMLDCSETRALLRRMGYESAVTAAQILPLLQAKFEQVFPHEVGLLLGIPAKDVTGFIDNKGADCLLCGYWKVYHEPRQASNLFQLYDRAKSKVMQRICRLQALEESASA
ncbi:MAG: DUF3793 family protein [Negativicutes bacterium]|nr:DUF3793 family protein [Negativicutes bacterium]